MRNILNDKKEFQFTLSIWQIVAIAGLAFLIPYSAWELFWYNRIGPEAIKLHTYLIFAAALVWLFLMPSVLTRFIRNYMLLGLVYVVLSMGLGEVHPFTLVPMYSKFMNYAYSFKLTDNKGNVIPFDTYYKVSSSGLSHKYFTMVQARNLPYGFQVESMETLEFTGKQLLKELQQSKKRNPPSDSLYLYMRCDSLRNGQVVTTEKLMYADKVTD